MTPDPYASVVLPTHGDRGTLDAAVASVLAQRHRDIELLLVSDGAGGATVARLRRWAGRDRRVRVLDLPKGEGRGEANRDRAVREARSPRIFYIDDDDLWLPDHVETLGPALEGSDVAESIPVSVTGRGRLAAVPDSHAHGPMRRLLAEKRHKSMFDTHLAHRKDAYLALPRGWRPELDGRPVLHFLAQFAADERFRWAAVPRVTALSLHGAARVDHAPEARAGEINHWRALVQGGRDGPALLAEATFQHHFWRLVQAVPAEGGEDLPRYCERLCLGVGPAAAPGRPALGPRHWDEVVAAWRFARGEPLEPAAAAEMLLTVTDPLLGPATASAPDLVRIAEDCVGRGGLAGVAEALRPFAEDHAVTRLLAHLPS